MSQIRSSLALLLLSLAFALLLSSAASALGQRERIELTDWLVADDLPAFEEAEVAYNEVAARLAEARAELDLVRSDYELEAGPREAAAAELEAAERDLRDAAAADAPREEILDLEDAVHAAREWLEEADSVVAPLAAERDAAEARWDALRDEHQEAYRIKLVPKREVVETPVLVGKLDDPTAQALYETLCEAHDEGWLPLDIDADALEWILRNEPGRRAIAKLPAAYEQARRDEGDGFEAFLCAVGAPECPAEDATALPQDGDEDAIEVGTGAEAGAAGGPASRLDR